MNIIIGSGLIGMISKEILGDDWDFITQKRSRYFSHDPILCDNYIIHTDESFDFLKSINADAIPIGYKRSFSFSGELFDDPVDEIMEPYLYKVYGDIPNHAKSLIKTNFFVHNTSAKQVHDILQKKQNNIIKSSLSEIVSIDIANKTLIYSKPKEKPKQIHYDNIISTVPLDVMMKWSNQEFNLESKTVCYYHIKTKFDLEGNDDCLICDNTIDFFKCVKLNENDFLFWTSDNIDSPHEYFGNILGYNMDIVDVFRIEKAIPIGEPPDLTELEKYGIHCIGSNAQWDDFIGISTCIKKIRSLSTL